MSSGLKTAIGLATLKEKLIGGGIVVAILLGIAAFVMVKLHQYHHEGVMEGENIVDNQWQQASDNLQNQASNSASQADDAYANRMADQRKQAADDRKAVEDAKAKNSSPLDALFGGGGSK